jgi:putative transposase
VRLNEIGNIARQTWIELPVHYPHAALDTFVVMPNHVHGIILLADDWEGAGLKPAPSLKMHALPEIIRAFKTFSARTINDRQGSRGESVWQRNYYEHVVRDENDLSRIRQYIVDNPACWAEDSNNPVVWDRRSPVQQGRV